MVKTFLLVTQFLTRCLIPLLYQGSKSRTLVIASNNMYLARYKQILDWEGHICFSSELLKDRTDCEEECACFSSEIMTSNGFMSLKGLEPMDPSVLIYSSIFLFLWSCSLAWYLGTFRGVSFLPPHPCLLSAASAAYLVLRPNVSTIWFLQIVCGCWLGYSVA